MLRHSEIKIWGTLKKGTQAEGSGRPLLVHFGGVICQLVPWSRKGCE